MDAERLQVFRDLLNARLDALIKNAGTHTRNLVQTRSSHADESDLASEESERDFSMRLADHERNTINQIRQALKRIDAGEYGYCAACGEDISHRRLMARPMSNQCIDCKTEAEQRHDRRAW